MNTDINKQIEEEARECYNETEGSLTCEEYFTKGAQFVLHSSRWRKVSEEMPEYSVDVLCKYDSGTLFIGYLSKVDNAFRVANTHYNVIREVIEWRPID